LELVEEGQSLSDGIKSTLSEDYMLTEIIFKSSKWRETVLQITPY